MNSHRSREQLRTTGRAKYPALWLCLCGLLWVLNAPAASTPAQENDGLSKSTADHTKFEELQVEFKSGPEVTRACLTCHTEAAKQIHRSKHWRWEFENPVTGQLLGKRNVANNFCTTVRTNEKGCTACHIGYGYEDDSFDFASEENVDCVVCHDTTGDYVKLPGYAGHPPYERVEFPPHSGRFKDAVDLTKVAQNVGKTSRATCGACHFKGGGGDGVKHGDMDSSLVEPMRYLDVHMDAQGLDFSCSSCHVTDGHAVAGSRYAPTAADDKGVRIPGREGNFRTTCQACHDVNPHDDGSARHDKINDHTDKLACQTCHIPEFARGGLPTKMEWDWSTAGKLDEQGKPFVTPDSAGWPAYMSKKGNFRWEQSVIPEYRWFNGRVDYVMIGEKIDADATTWINRFGGGPDDLSSRIWPVKIHRGKQPIDAVNNVLTVNHLYGNDDTAYWKNFDWISAAAAGMEAEGLPFSGEVGFASTIMAWPITHMVAPKEDALNCTQCHSDGGRLSAVEGVYMPGRDSNGTVEFIGKLMALLALLGVIGHSGLRYLSYRLSRR